MNLGSNIGIFIIKIIDLYAKIKVFIIKTTIVLKFNINGNSIYIKIVLIKPNITILLKTI